MSDTAIAIVGIGCRFPDAWTPEQFWSNIDGGVVSMRPLPDDLLRASGVDEATLQGEDYVKVGALLPGAAEFAAEFFGYTPREAELIDPQQRVFIEAAWEALERSGHGASMDRRTVGVFAGTGAGPYTAALFAAKAQAEGVAAAVGDLDLTLGGEVDFLPSRTAYKLGLRGPAVSVQTGCSSSLYALHYASLSLLAGECDIAIAGGSAVQEPLLGYRHKPGRALSEDGQCRSFDHRSSGTNHGSGVGVLVLRLLSDALADGDTVLAVLHGSAVGNDGSDKLGYVAPSTAGITRVVGKALQVAGLPGEKLRYVEAHGTATPLGDQVELAALTDAIRTTTDATGFCRLGSVMSNIGHTGPTAGIAGFIKAVNIARTGVLPPHPSFERPREPGVLAESPFTIATEPGRADGDCYVLVNSVGMGGSNAAAVLGPPPAPTRPAAPTGERVRLLLSARNRTELDALSRSLADHVASGEVAVADLAHTLRVGRRQFDERRLVVAEPGKLAAALRLPRPPLVKTLRSGSRRAAVVVAQDAVLPAGTLDLLRSALPADTVVAADLAAVPADRFLVLVGTGEAGANRYAFAADAADQRDEVEAALAEAWLHGVTVDWAKLAGDTGRRVPAPTYPFTRARYWALDRLSLAPDAAPRAAAPAVVAAAGDDEVTDALLGIWRTLFGKADIGLDETFGGLGGTSLLAMQLALEIQDRLGCPVNVHRAGGSRVTVRRLADLVHAHRDSSGAADAEMGDGLDQGDDQLVDADLGLSLGEVSATRSRGKDFLLTGATGYLGAFLLRELLARTKGRVYCLVRAEDEAAGLDRLRAAARKFVLPEPDADRVHVVPGDLADVAKVAALYRDGELERNVGHVLHCAAKVVFTEPYRTLREANVLPMADLLTWARGCGIRDFSYISTLAAASPAMGSANRYLETREQALDPEAGSYGVSKWVCERLLARAEEDGMRVRVFRPGLIMASSETGAGNDKDLIYFALISGLAIGAHPEDDRVLVMSPVDMVSKGVVDLALSGGAVGRAYHLVAERAISMRNLFLQLGNAGLATEPLPLAQWQERVRALALEKGNPILSAAALLELEGHDRDELAVQAGGWQPWLSRNGLDPQMTGAVLRRGIEYLARRDELVRDLVGHLVGGKGEN
ncbi:thioester reductase domain-containing protein [Actinosynnema sp. NPDC047251]|uniref:Polyketide synthase type I n=1 Tax=Saccharothrix espanaensis (strain ATCC 51144 / DSM 44229 / JCM 9112 / NBRC 15066 / NRRL 15764) TaxID=1179773 RepID=K0JZV6_SACES|nr:thioester reductase domain-containing protein [Saccharothrix espanaensis]CCH30837.1 Polyketide synthase type I [Saccharothrix espanaensis DSM 44229]